MRRGGGVVVSTICYDLIIEFDEGPGEETRLAAHLSLMMYTFGQTNEVLEQENPSCQPE